MKVERLNHVHVYGKDLEKTKGLFNLMSDNLVCLFSIEFRANNMAYRGFAKPEKLYSSCIEN